MNERLSDHGKKKNGVEDGLGKLGESEGRRHGSQGPYGRIRKDVKEEEVEKRARSYAKKRASLLGRHSPIHAQRFSTDKLIRNERVAAIGESYTGILGACSSVAN